MEELKNEIIELVTDIDDSTILRRIYLMLVVILRG